MGVVIVSAVRTPIGGFQRALKDISAIELGVVVIREAVKRANLNKYAGYSEKIDEVIMGNVLPAGLGQNPARQAMLRAGFPFQTVADTVNKVCGSGLKAIMLAEDRIALNRAEIIVAGGMESMSLVPEYKLGDGKLINGMIHDGLWDAMNDCHMGNLAEFTAEQYGITREEADKFALSSYKKTLKAMAEGKFKEEIIPVGNFYKDEIPRETSLEALSKLEPVFKDGEQVTAGNASKISDGAAALVIMSKKKAQELGIEPLAEIVAQGTVGIKSKYLLMAPVLGIQEILKKAGLRKGDIDLFEINEAFACSTAAVIKELGLDESKVNVRGGAVALGHPIGASGARVLVTLLYAMRDRDAKRGLVSVCLGGGEAVSLIVER